MAKIAESAPPACAVCHGQYPDRRHVDFEVAYDGPVLDGAARVMIDDLIMCEDCLRIGARLVGLIDAPGLRGKLDGRQQEIERLEAALLERDAYVTQLEQTLAAKPKPPAPAAAPRRRTPPKRPTAPAPA